MPKIQKIDMSKKTSYVWQHYKIIDHHNARCNVCNKRLSYKTSISNLKKHLNLKHPTEGILDPSDYATYPSTPSHDEEENDGENFDAEDVKTLLGLTEAQVNKNIEIIEEVNNGNHIVYNHEDRHRERVIKTKARPVLKKCLRAMARKIKKEPTSSDEQTPVIRSRDDTIDILTQNIANKLRKMTEKQQMIAEYRIHEILFLGLSNQLKHPVDYNNTQMNNYPMTGDHEGV